MAVAVIGGLITSTLLSLLVVFTFVDDLEHWLDRLVRRLRGRDGALVLSR